MMTPTFKLKRPQAQAAFQAAFDGGCAAAGVAGGRREACYAGGGGRGHSLPVTCTVCAARIPADAVPRPPLLQTCMPCCPYEALTLN